MTGELSGMDLDIHQNIHLFEDKAAAFRDRGLNFIADKCEEIVGELMAMLCVENTPLLIKEKQE
jgi:hypothetical protein